MKKVNLLLVVFLGFSIGAGLYLQNKYITVIPQIENRNQIILDLTNKNLEKEIQILHLKDSIMLLTAQSTVQGFPVIKIENIVKECLGGQHWTDFDIRNIKYVQSLTYSTKLEYCKPKKVRQK